MNPSTVEKLYPPPKKTSHCRLAKTGLSADQTQQTHVDVDFLGWYIIANDPLSLSNNSNALSRTEKTLTAAIMSRIICVALLLVVLMDNFYDNAVQSARFHVTKVHLRQCRCREFPEFQVPCGSWRPGFPITLL
ncbi:hypothetical protein GBF38_005510 [Scomber scombrus]|uniref:Uncharacterized protein n=1 Tax=Scomber scombrus TaxID=13677 RepID=A0AAV1PMB1_SCOSC